MLASIKIKREFLSTFASWSRLDHSTMHQRHVQNKKHAELIPLLGVTKHNKASLWAWHPQQQSFSKLIQHVTTSLLSDQVRQLSESMYHLAQQKVPIYGLTHYWKQFNDGAHVLVRVHSTNIDYEASLEGNSLGLSMFLCHAALMMGVSLKSHVICSAEVSSEGEIKGIDKLYHKLSLVADFPLMTHCMLSMHQKTEAKKLQAQYAHLKNIQFIPKSRSTYF